MIEVENLTKYFGPFAAITDVTFSVARGEIMGFLGPNGAGKTTTMRILAGSSPPSRGRAVVAGFDIARAPIEVKRRVGYLPESVPLYGEMLVWRFLHYVAEVKGIARGERRREVARVMERCGLNHMAKRVVRNLSKGYRQRVGLAQALLGNPPVLILDEPTVGLDPQQIIEIRQMIRDLGREHTILLSTHILPEVTMVCQRVLIINQGRIVAQDSMENLAGARRPLVELEVDGPGETVAAAIGRTPGVKTFTRKDARHYLVEGEPEADLEAPLARNMVEDGVALRGLRRRTRTLEDIFLDVVSAEAGAAGDGADGAARLRQGGAG